MIPENSNSSTCGYNIYIIEVVWRIKKTKNNETSVLANKLIANRSIVRRKCGPANYEDDGVIGTCALHEVIG